MVIKTTSLFIAASMVALAARGAAPVADISAVHTSSRAMGNQYAVAANSSDTYHLLQNLRAELRELRGMVEEQGNTIRVLKQHQEDNYLDLDRRLSGLAATGVTAQGASPKAAVGLANSSGGSLNSGVRTSSPSVAAAGNIDAAEKSAYENAYSALKSGQFASAKQGFTGYIAKYPRGSYSANSYYWLGEIYMLDNQLKEAADAFSVVVDQYPTHRKMLDASFKLGKVYHLQGNNEKAKVLLSKVAGTSGSVGKLATDYLKANF